MATHDLNAVSHITTHTAMIQGGRLVWAGPTRDAMTSENLSALYDTNVEVFERNGRRIALF
jgi:iron complex transport system ATP-binding protein